MRKRTKSTANPNAQKKQTSSKLVRFMALVALGTGFQTATQLFAHWFNYSESLGNSWHRLYLPWSIISWWQQAYSSYTQTCITAGSVGVLVAAIFIAFVLVIQVKRNTSTINETLHGSARWADKEDLEQSSLLGNDEGVYVGAWEDSKGRLHYLRHNGPEHILTYAPTRSGKGVGLVLPTLLSWPHSVVITDLKGELWAMTAGWRKTHAKNKVIRFEPASPNNSACWNSLDEIRLGTEYEVADVQNLGTLVVDPDGKGLNSHWQKTSHALLIGLILHALYKLKVEGFEASFPSVDTLLASPDLSIPDLLTEMTQYPHQNGKTHPVVYAAARDMIDRPEEEAGSVLSTLKSFLALYRCPIVAKNVSSSDFSVTDLMNHETPVSLYIVTQPNDKNRLQPLVRVLINMIVRKLADKMEFELVRPQISKVEQLMEWLRIRPKSAPFVQTKKTYKHRLLGMIDEFPSLGKLEILQESLAFVAGYGIKFYLICQDINQLKCPTFGYGPNETVTSNCHIQNAYPPNRLETAEHLSKLTGQATIVKEQITTSGKRVSLMLSQMSRSFQEVKRPLLTADECLRLPGPKKDAQGLINTAGDMVIYMAGFPMIYGKQPLYFKDPVFVARAAVPPPKISDCLRASLTLQEEIKL